MALFEARLWEDDKVQFPGRRRIIYQDSSYKDVYVERSQGTVYQEGDEFNAAVMNDLEKRIELAFQELERQINSAQAQLDLYYPVGKILMSMVNFRLESNPSAIFPGTNSTWQRLKDNRILLPVASGPDQVNSDETERQYLFPVANAGQTTPEPLIQNTKLSEAQIPAHSHNIVDTWGENNKAGGTYRYSTVYTVREGASAIVVGAKEAGTVSQNIQTGSTSYSKDTGHNHGYTSGVTITPDNASNKLQTVQKCIKIFVWRRIS